jgi:hypothetical protein
VVGKAPHAHRIFDGTPGAAERWHARRASDRDDVEVDRRREPPSQAQLLVARGMALLERAEVGEPKVDRLLDLERKAAC